MLSALLARRTFRPTGQLPSRGVALALGLSNALTLLGVLVATLLWARRHDLPTRYAIRFALVQSLLLCLMLAALGAATMALG